MQTILYIIPFILAIITGVILSVLDTEVPIYIKSACIVAVVMVSILVIKLYINK